MAKQSELTREQLQLIYDNTSDLVFLIEVRPDGGYRVESVNRAYLARSRIAPEDIVGLDIEQVLPVEHYDYIRARYDDAVASGEPYNYETRTSFGDRTIYLDTTLVPVTGADGRCTHLIGVSRDVTENKRERQALAHEKQRAENYLDIAEALIVALDTDCRITMLNRKGYRMLGYPRGSLIGRDWIELCIASERHQAFRSGFTHFLATGEGQRNVNYLRTSSGERRLISWANALIRDRSGQVVGVLSSGEDITDRKRAEDAMIASQRLLAADEVVSAVAHDFNNALQGILGNIEMAMATTARPEQFHNHLTTAAKLADDAARRLRALRGPGAPAQPGDREPVNLHELIDDAVAQTQPLWKDEAQRHGIDVRISRRLSESELMVVGNRSELRSVLYNVLKNAVEALRDDGDIELSTTRSGGQAVLTVRDTGVGMDRETSTRVFQPFFTTKGMEAGRGLGMSASHSIVAAHRGEISVSETRPGGGTTFEIRLPLSRGSSVAPTPHRDAGAARGHHVLWVDDDAEIRTLAGNYLRALGHTGDVVDSGARAIELLDQHRYTVVITDVGMPGMSGLDLARHVQLREGARPPVIALTGWGDSIVAGDGLPPGIHDVIAKPVRLQQVRELLEGLDAASPNTND